MTDPIQKNEPKTSPVTDYLSEQEVRDKAQILISYSLMAIGLFTGLMWLVGGLWAWFKRSDCSGGRFYSHFNNAITTMWIGIFGSILTILFIQFLVGFLIFSITLIWVLFRLIRGFAKATSDKSY